ncbi:MAG: D-glycero-beta-D-manno-heptose 1,7-bisphosphate 7-phosphatase [Candidatus Promineifilaceae bacterium]
MQPAVFLDRDGVIIENRPAYVRRWADVAIYPGALAALARLSATAYKIVVVTNQSAVGRGLVRLAAAEAINRRLTEQVRRAGGRLDGVYMCPHAPAAGCDCRKPRPGLLRQAAADLDLEMGRSLLVGDALTDLAAGRAAGVGRLALVRTGRGADQLAQAAAGLADFEVYDTLAAALQELACPT